MVVLTIPFAILPTCRCISSFKERLAFQYQSKMSNRTNPKIGAVKRAVEAYIHPANNRSDIYVNYRNWYCGVTNDTTERKAQHKYEKDIPAMYFHFWDAGSKANALAIEAHFHKLGMRGESKSSGGVKNSSRYVYVFKWHTNIADDLARFFESNE